MTQTIEDQFPKLTEHLRQALKQWNRDSHTPSPVSYLYLYRKAKREEGTSPRRATNRVLTDALDILEEQHQADAQILRKRFLDREKVSVVANHRNVAESTVYDLQTAAIKRLAGTVYRMEEKALIELRSVMGERLPAPTSTNLIGVETHLKRLIKSLSAPKPPWIVSITGLGGIGKTSLADALARYAVEKGGFDDIGWVSARQSHLTLTGEIKQIEQPALTAEDLMEALLKQLLPEYSMAHGFSTEKISTILRAYLEQHPHLIVIDNLETLRDVEELLPILQRLANPTKFVLTSRERLHDEPNIYHFVVPELEEPDALALIRQEAQLGNLSTVANCEDDILKPICQVAGGNPLALRLVVGQLQIYSLDEILEDLAGMHGDVSTLYTFIYRRAWDSLDELSQRALLLMTLVRPTGDDIAYLSESSELAVADLRVGLKKLVMMNLVEVRGDLHQRRYSIHGLTRTFLQTQVIQWQ